MGTIKYNLCYIHGDRIMIDNFSNLMKEAIEQMSGEHIEFNGMNCYDLDDNECKGWDGLSTRCDCGNRRVYWCLSDDGTYVYAEAD